MKQASLCDSKPSTVVSKIKTATVGIWKKRLQHHHAATNKMSQLPNDIVPLKGKASLSVSPTGEVKRVYHESGYAQTIYEGKNEQMLKVSRHIEEKGFIPTTVVKNEVAWFYG